MRSKEKNLFSFLRETPFFLLVIICFFPLLPFGIISVSIILFFALSILFNLKGFKEKYHKIGLVPLLMNAAFFLAMAFTLIYSENLKLGWRQIEKGLPLLLFPVVFLYFPPRLGKTRIKILMGSFVFANALFLGILFSYLVENASDYVLSTNGRRLILFEGLKDMSFPMQLKTLWENTFYEVLYYARKSKESVIEIHKTYVAQNLIWCIVIIGFYSKNKKSKIFEKTLQTLVFIVFIAALIYLYSFMNLLLLAVLLPFVLFAFFGKVKKRLFYVLGVLLFLIGGVLMIFNTQHLSSDSYERYKQYENPAFVFSNIKKMLGNDERNVINQCNMEIIKGGPLFGFGVGDAQQKLNDCYSRFENSDLHMKRANEQKLNSHNYYAFLWISGGIVAVLLFLFMLGFNASIAIKERDFLYIIFLIIISMNLLTETHWLEPKEFYFFLYGTGFYCIETCIWKNKLTNMESPFSLEDFLVVMVLYRTELENSPSFISLSKCNRESGPLTMLVYDNSPKTSKQESYFEKDGFQIHYVHDSNNPGVSKAYNTGIDLAERLNKKWILFLDQDTTLDVSLLDLLLDKTWKHKDIYIFATTLFDASGNLVSPCRYFFKRGFRLSPVPSGKCELKTTRPINSSVLISSKVFEKVGLYNESIRLDFSDHEFFDRVSVYYSDMYVLASDSFHSLSSTDETNIESIKNRFVIFCDGARTAAGGTFLKSLQYILVCLFRAISLGVRHRTFYYVKTLVLEWTKTDDLMYTNKSHL